MFRQKIFELRILFWVTECIVLCLRLQQPSAKKLEKKSYIIS